MSSAGSAAEVALAMELSHNQDFEFTWRGREAAAGSARSECTKRLVPAPAESIGRNGERGGFDSGSLYIEGDSLDALKLLKDSLDGRVRVIYIDPPYNTGNFFVYRDSFSHSEWLNLLYPRLLLARSVLAEDGAIFISIDDTEIDKLRLICGEIFGEENFINTFLWLHGKGKKDSWSRTLQQYVVAYAKNKACLAPWQERKPCLYRFSNPDNDPKGPWFSGSVSFSEARSNPRHRNFYSITSPSGRVWRRQWLLPRQELLARIKDGDVFWGPAPEFDRVPRLKIRPGSERSIIPGNVLDSCSTTRSAERHIAGLFGKNVFSYPKPVELVEHFLDFFDLKGSIVLDFFSGSATTAEAVFSYNKAHGSDAGFILVQQPEVLDRSKRRALPAEKAVLENAADYLSERGLPLNLCEIGKERIALAGQGYTALADRGFRVYKII